MIVYLAGEAYASRAFPEVGYDFNRLDSFHYLTSNKFLLQSVSRYPKFILDSGAFSFMVGTAGKGEVDWDAYINQYAQYIKTNNIRLYFELDIDSLVGYGEVRRLREVLEKTVGWKCIPVWHRSRGLDDYKQMCKDYDYAAIGGLVTKEIKKAEYGIFTLLLDIARKSDCKMHGLGFTDLAKLRNYKFHSVDSSSWTFGNRGGYVCLFKPRTGTFAQIDPAKMGLRIGNQYAVALHNLKEWVKFTKYAERHL